MMVGEESEHKPRQEQFPIHGNRAQVDIIGVHESASFRQTELSCKMRNVYHLRAFAC